MPDGDVEVRIEDAAGEAVRTLEGSKDVGINRVWWDLRTEPSTEIRLRTPPLHADWVDLNDDRWRPAPRGTSISVLSPPGAYTVTLVVGGVETSTELTVLKDPHSEGSLDDVRVQTAMLKELRDELSEAAEMVNRIEWIRRQLHDTRAVLEEQSEEAEILTAADELDRNLVEIEETLIQLRSTGTGQDYVRWPARLVSRLEYLAGTVAVSDFPPTDQSREVHELLKERLRTAATMLETLMAGEVAEFNEMLREAGQANIITDGAGE